MEQGDDWLGKLPSGMVGSSVQFSLGAIVASKGRTFDP